MKTKALKVEFGGGRARSILECDSPILHLNGSTDAACQSVRGLVQSKTWRILGTVLIFLAITISVRAQSYSVDWYKISGGGGTTGVPNWASPRKSSGPRWECRRAGSTCR